MVPVRFSGQIVIRCSPSRKRQKGRVQEYLQTLKQEDPGRLYLNDTLQSRINTVLGSISLSRLKGLFKDATQRFGLRDSQASLTLSESGRGAVIDYGRNETLRMGLHQALMQAGAPDFIDTEGPIFGEDTKQQAREPFYTLAKPPIYKALGEMLIANKLKVGIAESCTAGLASALLTHTPGSSDYTGINMVTYATAAKQHYLGVPRKIVERHTVYSYEVAEKMAEGIRQANESDYGLAYSGLTGHTEQFEHYPGGVVFIGLSGKGKPTQSRMIAAPATMDRIGLKQFFAEEGLKLLKQYIDGKLPGQPRAVLDLSTGVAYPEPKP